MDSNNETLGLKNIIVGYLHRWRVFVVVGFLSFIPALLYLFLMPKTYEIFARIQVQDPTGSGGSFGLGEAAGLMKSFGLGSASSGTVSLEDEIAILTSNQLIRETIKELGMEVTYSNPDAFFYDMYTNSPLLLTYNSQVEENLLDKITFKVTIDSDGKVQVKVKSKEDSKKYTFTFPSLPAQMVLDQGIFELKYRDQAQAVRPYKMKINVKPIYWMAEDMVEELLVEDLSKSANIIELGMEDYERRRAVDFLNTLIRLYNKQAEDVRKTEADKTMAFIDSRMVQITSELEMVEKEIERFKTANNMTDLEYDIQFYVTQMQEIQMGIVEFEMQNMMVKAMDDYVKDPANRYNQVPMLLTAKEGETGGAIMVYNTKLLERNQFLKTSKEESPLINQIEDQLTQLREGVGLSISNTQESLAATLKELKAKEKMILDKMGKVPELEKDYINYKRQQEIYQGVYLLMLQKREDTALSIGELKDQAHVIDPAFVKEKPVGPRKLYAAIGMLLMTLIFPIVWIEGRKLYTEVKDEYKRTAKQ